MGRRKNSAVEDIVEIGAKLPLWLSLVATVLTFVLFHSLSQIEPGVVTVIRTPASSGDAADFRAVAELASKPDPMTKDNC
jgi:hypothetical protein